MWRAIRSAFGGGTGERRRATLDEINDDWFRGHAFALAAPTLASADSLSAASNPSVSSSYHSSARRRTQQAIAQQYFGPGSQTHADLEMSGHGTPASPVHAFAGSFAADLSCRSGDSDDVISELPPTAPPREESLSQRQERKENERAFEDLVHLANTKQPVTLRAFKRKPSAPSSTHGIDRDEEEEELSDKQLNTELIEAYVTYAHSIGHEPEIEVALHEVQSGDSEDGVDEEPLATERLSFVHVRGRVDATEHWGTQWIGTRFSRRRGCVQFWAFLLLGMGVTFAVVLFLTQVRLNEVLHLDAFVGDDVAVSDDFAFLHLRDGVGLRLTYDIDAGASDVQVLLLTKSNFEQFRKGQSFTVLQQASRRRTAYARLPLTRIDNDNHDELYLVVQHCELLRGNATIGMCVSSDATGTAQLPAPVSSHEKLFALRRADPTSPTTRTLRRYSVNPMPDTCSSSGWRGAPFLLLFVPYVLASLFGLRVFHMLVRCESFRANLERTYKHEFAVPEEEVDYWQPSPWDRKVPKTRLLGPCCWRKMRCPREPFYTWWRHENYFTWVFFPYRNEQLARGERALIVFCSLYITFYVTFLLAMAHGSLGDHGLPAVVAVALYWLLLFVLPALGKAVFKEIFKLIFRQRRKYFRLKAIGGDTSQFSFRLAFLLQVLVVAFVTLAQTPLLYMWRNRSCTFLAEFMYFGLVAAIARLSLVGLLADLVWYAVLCVCGWRDLCPHCTERLVDCDCFNDELLVLAVERVGGAKWALILLLDGVLSRHAGHEPQFAQYSAAQLGERWRVLVKRAEAHLETVEKLRAYRLTKTRTRGFGRLVERASLRSSGGREEEENETSARTSGLLGDLDSVRERKILSLDLEIRKDALLKRPRNQRCATIADSLHSMQHAVHGHPTAGASESSTSVVLTTPAQRLARREDERERRARAFSEMRDYRIEKRPPQQVRSEEAVALKQANRFGWLWSWRPFCRGSSLSQAREPLVPTAPTRESLRSNVASDIVVMVAEEPTSATVDEGDEARETSIGADDDAAVVTYDVTPRAPTWWDTTVGRAGAFVGWLVKYDRSQY